MSFESFEPSVETGRRVKDLVETKIFDAAGTYVEQYGPQEGVKRFVADYFGAARMHPRYESADKGMSLEIMRERLHREPGVVFSNHPDGYFDIPAVVSAIADRSDVKIMVKEEIVESLTRIFGPRYFVPAAKDVTGARGVIDTVAAHIRDGGLFLIFPGGGDDGIKKEARRRKTAGLPPADTLPQIRFQNFVPLLLRKALRDTDMVYSFYSNPEEVNDCLGQLGLRLPLMMPGILRGEVVSPYEASELSFTVGERYSTADEWKSLLKPVAASREGIRQALTERYLRQFGVELLEQDE